MRSLWILILIAIFGNASGQFNSFIEDSLEATLKSNELPFYNKARLSIESNQQANAISSLDTLSQIYPQNQVISFLKGACLVFNESRKRESYPAILFAKDMRSKLPEYDYWLGIAYQVNDSLILARKFLDDYVQAVPANEQNSNPHYGDAKRRLENLNKAEQMLDYSNMVHITNIGPPINTEASEYVPLLPSDESFMIFTYRGKLSKGGKQNFNTNSLFGNSKEEEAYYFEDVFISQRIDESTWSPPKPIRSINTSLHDAAVTLSQDGTLLFIYKNLGSGKGDLYLSTLNGNVWTVPVYQKGLNSDQWDGSAAFFPDNKHIIFSSERKGGYGGKDLYMAELISENRWGNIQNMGEAINTKYDEDAPFITADGKILFFSSNGKLSTGGYDILRSDMNQDGKWGTPYNVGKPINTPNDDKFFMVTGDGKKGYYSTYKNGGEGQQDIYCIEPGIPGKPVKVVQVTGNVTYNDKPVPADIYIKSTSNSSFQSYSLTSNSATGKFLINLPSNEKFEIGFNFSNFPTQVKEIHTFKVDSFIQLSVFADFYSDAYLKALEKRKDSLDKVASMANANVNLNDFRTNYGDIKIDSLFYKVQIGAYRFIENFDYSKTLGVGKIIRKVYSDGITRFTIGNYATFNEALNKLETLKSSVPDAFIIIVYKNKYYYLKDILKSGLINIR